MRLENVENNTLCSHEIRKKQIQQFQYAVLNKYWFQMFVDDLPMRGISFFTYSWIDNIVGVVGTEDNDLKKFVYTHQEFDISYNGHQIIESNLTMQNPVLLSSAANTINLTFTYSVRWHPTETAFKDRFEKYLDSEFFEHKVILSITIYIYIYISKSITLQLKKSSLETWIRNRWRLWWMF
jgi:transmembrane 9 superfamily protein 3